MAHQLATTESLESRMLLSAAAPHAALFAGHHHAVSGDAIHQNLPHAVTVQRAGRRGGRHRTPPAAGLPSSGPFSYTYAGYTISGTIDAGTHSINGTITGHSLDLTITGTVDPATHRIQGTITGSNTDLTVDATLSGDTLTGSIDGTFEGFPISLHGTFPI